MERPGAVIERRLVRFALRVFATTGLITALFGLSNAHAQVASQSKLAGDLLSGMTAPSVAPPAPTFGFTASRAPSDGAWAALPIWAKDINGTRYVKVLIVSNSTDPDLTDLEAALAQEFKPYAKPIV